MIKKITCPKCNYIITVDYIRNMDDLLDRMKKKKDEKNE